MQELGVEAASAEAQHMNSWLLTGTLHGTERS
jgi:hypothetical protein